MTPILSWRRREYLGLVEIGQLVDHVGGPDHEHDVGLGASGLIEMVDTAFERFVWHCHLVEHEDNEMMRPYRIGP